MDLGPIYDKPIQPRKEVKIDDLHRETKETRNEIGALKQNLQALQKTQSLESTSYQSNEESPSDNEVHQTANLRADTIQEPSTDLFLDAITRSNFHKWHSKVRIVISQDLGNPFLCSLYPFTVDSNGITTQPFGQSIRFRFTSEPIPRNINTIQAGMVSNLINAKTAHYIYIYIYWAGGPILGHLVV